MKQYPDYKTLHDLAGQLEMTKLFPDASKYILLPVYTQIIARKSLYKLPEHIESTVLKKLLSIDKLADKHLYEALDKLEEMDFSVIEQRLFKKLSAEKQEKTALVLDITDTYFSGSRRMEIKKRKRSKYGKLSYKIAILKAGHIGQNIYLVSDALGLKCCAHGDFNKNLVHKLLYRWHNKNCFLRAKY